uniref:Uncharacterized protein n=1 Tax=Ditylenchus dipsaci TaxID=166011 RepID=A0A915E4N1_9BILA
MQRGKETEEQRFQRKIAEEAKVLAEFLPGWKKEIKFVIGVTNPITDLRIRVVQLAMEEHIAWKVMNCIKTALQDLPREPVIHAHLAATSSSI